MFGQQIQFKPHLLCLVDLFSVLQFFLFLAALRLLLLLLLWPPVLESNNLVYDHGHCKWYMPKQSTKLPISGNYIYTDVQMFSKTQTDVVDHVCCLLHFIHRPGLITQCYSENKLKRNCKNVITVFWHEKVVHCRYHQAAVAFVCSSTQRLTSLKRSIFWALLSFVWPRRFS